MATSSDIIAHALEIAEKADGWSDSLGVGGFLSFGAVAFCHEELISQEAFAVAARLTQECLVPTGWREMSPGERLDAISKLVEFFVFSDPRSKAAIASRINRMLSRKLESRRGEAALTARERLFLVSKSGRRCYICGRKFSNGELDAFCGGRSRKASSDRKRYDRYKPIYRFRLGWTIDIDHRVPISCDGDNELENLYLACHYCNTVKREWLSIFDRPPKRASLDGGWEFQSLRLLSLNGCEGCRSTVKDTELTIAPRCPDAMLTLQNMQVFCYRCDSHSASRWRPIPGS